MIESYSASFMDFEELETTANKVHVLDPYMILKSHKLTKQQRGAMVSHAKEQCLYVADFLEYDREYIKFLENTR